MTTLHTIRPIDTPTPKEEWPTEIEPVLEIVRRGTGLRFGYGRDKTTGRIMLCELNFTVLGTTPSIDQSFEGLIRNVNRRAEVLHRWDV